MVEIVHLRCETKEKLEKAATILHFIVKHFILRQFSQLLNQRVSFAVCSVLWLYLHFNFLLLTIFVRNVINNLSY